MKPLLIIGASSFGRLIQVLAEECGREVEGFIDDFHSGKEIVGDRSKLGSRYTPDRFDLVLAVGYRHMAARLEIMAAHARQGFDFPALVHPQARVSRKAEIGAGCLVMAGANIDAFVQVESLCVLWPEAVVSHDTVVGTNCFLSPGAVLCGFVNVGASTFIGAGSVVVDGTTIPPGSFIKAGIRHSTKA